MNWETLLLSVLTSQEFALALGYFYAVIVGDRLVHGVINEMWILLREEAKSTSGDPPLLVNQLDALKTFSWQVRIVGIVERVLYMVSMQIQKPEFIAIWLTLKTVARSRRWTEEETVPGRAVFNNFLVGNGLSILFALASVGSIEWAAGPISERNYILAIGVPIILALSTGALYIYFRRERRRRTATQIRSSQKG